MRWADAKAVSCFHERRHITCNKAERTKRVFEELSTGLGNKMRPWYYRWEAFDAEPMYR